MNIKATVSPRPPDPGARLAPPEPCLEELRQPRSGWDQALLLKVVGPGRQAGLGRGGQAHGSEPPAASERSESPSTLLPSCAGPHHSLGPQNTRPLGQMKKGPERGSRLPSHTARATRLHQGERLGCVTLSRQEATGLSLGSVANSDCPQIRRPLLESGPHWPWPGKGRQSDQPLCPGPAWTPARHSGWSSVGAGVAFPSDEGPRLSRDTASLERHAGPVFLCLSSRTWACAVPREPGGSNGRLSWEPGAAV